MKFWNFFKKKPPIERAYAALAKAARTPALYTMGAPDSFDGRFDMMVLHLHLVLRRLRALGQGRAPEAQSLFDHFFTTLDEALREMGVGDLSVGKKIRKMAQAYYGRAAAYDVAFAAADPQTALTAVLTRNLYPELPESPESPETPAPIALDALAAHILEKEHSLRAHTLAQIMAGDIFAPLSAPAQAAPKIS